MVFEEGTKMLLIRNVIVAVLLMCIVLTVRSCSIVTVYKCQIEQVSQSNNIASFKEGITTDTQQKGLIVSPTISAYSIAPSSCSSTVSIFVYASQPEENVYIGNAKLIKQDGTIIFDHEFDEIVLLQMKDSEYCGVVEAKGLIPVNSLEKRDNLELVLQVKAGSESNLEELRYSVQVVEYLDTTFGI